MAMARAWRSGSWRLAGPVVCVSWPEVTPTVRAQRVVYARGRGVREWYAAGPLGVEAGLHGSRTGHPATRGR